MSQAQATTVRLAHGDDAAAIARIHVAGWQAAYRGLVPDVVLDGFDVTARTERWQAALAQADPDGPERTWVTEANDVVTGFAMTGRARDESAPPPDGAGEVYAIYVHPDHVGMGHGRILFAHAVDDLRARGLDPLVVWVFEDNPRARRFYEAAGFRPDGARHEIDFDGVCIPEVRYRLDGGRPAR